MAWQRTLALVAATVALSCASPALATRPADVPAMGTAPPLAPIASDRGDALLEPREWDCDRIRPEYNAWLRSGHRARDWKYVGKLYQAHSTGEYYTWNDWLDWSRKTRCGSWGQSGVDRQEMGTAIWVTGMILMFVNFGGGFGRSPDSPG